MLDLVTNGDNCEQRAYPLFIKEKFPSYESFWQEFIVPLTNRPTNIYTKSDRELVDQFPHESIERIHERISILQLHYSVLRMLLKIYEKRKAAETDIDAVESCFSHLYSALDIAAELFGRYERIKNDTVITSDSFNPSTATKDSYIIRKGWQKAHPYTKEIEYIRNYRNLMLHGQMFGAIATPAAGYIALPRPEEIENYLDWRKTGESFHSRESNNLIDFLYSSHIVDPATEKVLEFLNAEWRINLL